MTRCAEALFEGLCAVLPADTLYGLSARALDRNAVERVRRIKGREAAKSMPLFVADAEQAARWGVLTPAAQLLIAGHWPGPLTLVVEASDDGRSEMPWALAPDGSLALRAPANAAVRDLLRRYRGGTIMGPLTGTSANRSGEPAANTLEEARRQLGGEAEIAVWLDGGRQEGTPSTIVDARVDPPVLIRAGALPWPPA